MNFTREPIVETIISPKEGYKLVLKNTKTAGCEEFAVDYLELVSFGSTCFYRSTAKQKGFLLPAADYELVETRDTRVVLKTTGLEKGGIKIGGGREGALKAAREVKEIEEEGTEKAQDEARPSERGRDDRKREKKRFNKKKRKQGGEVEEEEVVELEATFPEEESISETASHEPPKPREERTFLIPPPTTLISESLSRYKDTQSFSGAFFEKKEEPQIEELKEGSEESKLHNKRILLEEPEEYSFLTEDEEQEPEDLS